jgi:hypothetical protein
MPLGDSLASVHMAWPSLLKLRVTMVCTHTYIWPTKCRGQDNKQDKSTMALLRRQFQWLPNLCWQINLSYDHNIDGCYLKITVQLVLGVCMFIIHMLLETGSTSLAPIAPRPLTSTIILVFLLTLMICKHWFLATISAISLPTAICKFSVRFAFWFLVKVKHARGEDTFVGHSVKSHHDQEDYFHTRE